MSGHCITRCSCGKVISQCRCPDRNKTVNIIENGCDDCHKRTETLESKIRSIAEYLGCNADELVSEITKLFKDQYDR